MKPLLAILTILTMALATAEASQVLKKKSPHHPDILAQCEDAPNCKTYDTGHGLMFQFKPGMEPGTADYAARFPNTTEHRTLIKRDTRTHVTFGETSINYGTTNPCGALHHCLYDYCHEGSCDSNICTVETKGLVRSGASLRPRSRLISFSSYGQHNGWSERNHYVDSVAAAASKGQKWDRHDWCIRTKEGDTCGTQWWGRQTNFISVNKFYNGNLRGFIQSSVAMDVNEGNCCATLAGALGAIAGAVNPIADGLFGLVNALCA
ncbi:hypothetical protein BKA61DRAFT_698670 [Leptodontidium sp. MPI-SDFR-AT-0119]|nr:hypothetical protein BKA61DRAFT_698670 [Leptodontidium sp. MPI-SDFR-AT-0119]